MKRLFWIVFIILTFYSIKFLVNHYDKGPIPYELILKNKEDKPIIGRISFYVQSESSSISELKDLMKYLTNKGYREDFDYHVEPEFVYVYVYKNEQDFNQGKQNWHVMSESIDKKIGYKLDNPLLKID